jgi:uncharacterized protein (DUF697 family)
VDDERSSPQGDRLARTVRRYTVAALGAAVVPLPVADILAISGVQILMLRALNGAYARRTVYFDEMIGTAVAALAGFALWGSLAKLVPGLGTLAGGAIQAGIAGTATYALGMTWIEFLERGERFSLEELKGSFAAWLRRARPVVRAMRDPEAELESNRQLVLERLREEHGEKIGLVEAEIRAADARRIGRILRRISASTKEGRRTPLHEVLAILERPQAGPRP